jgi:hypothetical protein
MQVMTVHISTTSVCEQTQSHTLVLLMCCVHQKHLMLSYSCHMFVPLRVCCKITLTIIHNIITSATE